MFNKTRVLAALAVTLTIIGLSAPVSADTNGDKGKCHPELHRCG